MKHRAFIPLVVLLILALLSGCSDNASSTPASSGASSKPETVLEKIDVVLDWTPNTNHTGLYVAMEKGWYEEVGLNVRLVQSVEGGALPLLATNQAEFGISFQEDIAMALSTSSPLPVLAVASIIDHNLSGLISLASKGIETPKDLEGMRYASWDTPLEKAIINDIIAADGGDPELLVYVPNTVTDIFSALEIDIDLVWIFRAWDGIAADVKGLDYNYLDFRELNPVFDFYTPVIAASQHFVETNPDAAKRFLAATQRGYEYACAEPEEAANILCAYVPELDADIVHASQIFLADQYSAEKEHWGGIDADRWTIFFNWLYEEGIISVDLGSQGFSNDYLPQ